MPANKENERARQLNVLVIQDSSLPRIAASAFELTDFVSPFEARLFLITAKPPTSEQARKSFAEIAEVPKIHINGTMEVIAHAWHERHKFDVVYCNDEDLMLRAAHLRRHFNINTGMQPDTAIRFRDKFLMKQCAAAGGLVVPEFSLLQTPSCLLDFVARVGFPVVIKPIFGCCGEDVTVIRDRTDVDRFLASSFFAKMSNRVDSRHVYMAEAFVNGDMCHANGFVENGKIVALWIFKYISNNMDFTRGYPYGNIQLTKKDELYPAIKANTQKLITALLLPRQESLTTLENGKVSDFYSRSNGEGDLDLEAKDKREEERLTYTGRFAFHAEFFCPARGSCNGSLVNLASADSEQVIAVCEIAARTPGGTIADLINRAHYSDARKAASIDPRLKSFAAQVFRFCCGLPPVCALPLRGPKVNANDNEEHLEQRSSGERVVYRYSDVLVPRIKGTKITSVPLAFTISSPDSVDPQARLEISYQPIAKPSHGFYHGFHVSHLNTAARFVCVSPQTVPISEVEASLWHSIMWYLRNVRFARNPWFFQHFASTDADPAESESTSNTVSPCSNLRACKILRLVERKLAKLNLENSQLSPRPTKMRSNRRIMNRINRRVEDWKEREKAVILSPGQDSIGGSNSACSRSVALRLAKRIKANLEKASNASQVHVPVRKRSVNKDD